MEEMKERLLRKFYSTFYGHSLHDMTSSFSNSGRRMSQVPPVRRSKMHTYVVNAIFMECAFHKMANSASVLR